METKQQHNADVTKQAQQDEKLYMENTLLRVAGALFCHEGLSLRLRAYQILSDRGFGWA